MGITSIDSRHRLALPHTPPELLSPGTPLYPTRLPEDRSWNSGGVPISPPMSNYDPSAKAESSVRSSDGSQPVRDGVQTAPRQQLPSLSSLFGPPSSVRPLHSPLSDRPGSHMSTSPHDRQSSLSTSLERPYSSSSYFPSTAPPSMSQPRSVYDPRFEERLPFGPLSRAFPGPLSPRTREEDRQRPEPESEPGHSARWSIHQEASRNGYALGGREASYQPPHDRLPQLGGRKYEADIGMGYREQRPPQANGQHPPPTPGSIVTIEGVTVKDGLGPKIWTGTHFLPRFVRAAEVPGEGLCYFYDDGSHCKTVIDGEAVNAHWGVTKAGKPRKRLAIACITCREKKIKCDPDYPRCVQCEKFGRVCKFKNAPRGGNNTSPSTPPAETDDGRQLPPLMRPPPEHQRPGSHSSGSVSPRTALRPASPEPAGHSAKRIRVGYEHYAPAGVQRSPMIPVPDMARSNVPWQQHQQPQQRELPRIHEDVLCRVWQTDPYVSDPQSVLNTISSFFVHADATALRFLPEKVFKEFVQASAHRKSPEDLMLVYSVLALGVSLSGGSKMVAHEYSEVARYATDRTALSLQLVQARILLSLYYLQVSRSSDANDMSSAAISTATCLQLNMELESSQDGGSAAKYPFGMSFAGFGECRRRTFWSCFLLERLNGLFPTRISIINKEDIFLSLPRDVQSFENQVDSVTPPFDPDLFALQQRQSGMHIMGYLVQIVALWGDVMTTIYRLAHRGEQYSFDFAKCQTGIMSRLEDWKCSLVAALAFNPLNLHLVPSEEKGSFILMHLVYHLTMIKLHRHILPRFLTAAQRQEHSLAAREHAEELLDIVCAMAKESSIGRSMMPPPFTSYAILEVVDVLSAEGPLSALPRLVDRLATARSVIEILATVWDDATGHKVAMDHRLDKLANLRDLGSAAEASSAAATASIQGLRVFVNEEEVEGKRLPAGACWQMTGALEGRFPKDMDTVYTSLMPLPVYSK